MKTNGVVALKRISLSLLSGVLLLIAWFPSPVYFLLFVAFVPLFIAIKPSKHSPLKQINKILLILPVFFIWSCDNFWVFKIDQTAAFLIIIINTLVISVPFVLYSVFEKDKNTLFRYVFLLSAWWTTDFLYQSTLFSNPLFTPGNGMASVPKFIQWYEFTGVKGGSAWILIINILIFEIFNSITEKNKIRSVYLALSLFLSFLLPVSFSIYLHRNYKENGTFLKIAVTHSSLDCYGLKYKLTNSQIADIYFSSFFTTPGDSIDILIWPETALPSVISKDSIRNSELYFLIRKKMAQRGINTLITGSVLKIPELKIGHLIPEFNSAVFIQTDNDSIQIKTKYKCVPLTEYTPNQYVMNWIKKQIPSLAGYKFSINKESGHTTFYYPYKQTVIKPLICFESAYGDFNLKPVKENTILCVILNEGWYNNLNVARQFLYLSSIRAIEQRKNIARSSNLGMTGFVNSKGEPVNSVFSKYGPKKSVATICANNKSTFYSRYYSILNLLGMVIFLLLLTRNIIKATILQFKSLSSI